HVKKRQVRIVACLALTVYLGANTAANKTSASPPLCFVSPKTNRQLAKRAIPAAPARSAAWTPACPERPARTASCRFSAETSRDWSCLRENGTRVATGLEGSAQTAP